MQEDQYLDYFLPRFKQLGYKCYFKKRYGNEKLDGCCIIFKWRKFRLIKLECIDFFVSNVPILNRY
jgi:mRNA deadenylase 3'-5' endonuclease subunit Ccr4